MSQYRRKGLGPDPNDDVAVVIFLVAVVIIGVVVVIGQFMR